MTIKVAIAEKIWSHNKLDYISPKIQSFKMPFIVYLHIKIFWVCRCKSLALESKTAKLSDESIKDPLAERSPVHTWVTRHAEMKMSSSNTLPWFQSWVSMGIIYKDKPQGKHPLICWMKFWIHSQCWDPLLVLGNYPSIFCTLVPASSSGASCEEGFLSADLKGSLPYRSASFHLQLAGGPANHCHRNIG